mmetsp:Transcript_13625/g.39000  ORF Transcript_13625/g.39000 Transcript_13625/m.39000 type:complete len:243 (+) Transcript_13625:111-839(+)
MLVLTLDRIICCFFFFFCNPLCIQKAARRLLAYWEARFNLFGPDKAFLPMTLRGAMRDDAAALEVGFVRSFSFCSTGSTKCDRQIMYLDPSRLDASQYTRESMLRTFWYTIHAMLENDETQRRGIIIISNPRYAKYWQFDFRQFEITTASLKGDLPIRISAIHICNPPIFKHMVVLPIIKFMLLSKTTRRRLNVHRDGDQMQIMHKLEDKFGFDRHDLPSDLGGSLILDHIGWLKERYQNEL